MMDSKQHKYDFGSLNHLLGNADVEKVLEL